MIGIDAHPTPSLLFYLFADRLGVAGHERAVGTLKGIVPCNEGFAIQTWELAELLLVSAFWGLREAGLIRLDVESKLLLYISRHTYVTVTLLNEADITGLEGQLLAAMHRNPYESRLNRQIREKTLERLESSGKQASADRIRERTEQRRLRSTRHLYVERVVPHWFGERFIDPAMHVIEMARETAVTQGWIQVDTSHDAGLLGRQRAKQVFRPRCDRISTLHQQFEETVGQWSDFMGREASLHKQLQRQCRQGMRNALTGGRM